jgi:hypothetical protein
MPELIDIITAGRLIGLPAEATRAAVEEGTFPLPISMAGRRRTVPRSAILRAMRAR